MDCTGSCNPDAMAAGMAIIGVLLVLFIALVVTAITALIYCRIFHKAGYHWALGLLLLVPIANIIIAFYLAFSDWPIQKELRAMKQSAGGGENA